MVLIENVIPYHDADASPRGRFALHGKGDASSLPSRFMKPSAF